MHCLEKSTRQTQSFLFWPPSYQKNAIFLTPFFLPVQGASWPKCVLTSPVVAPWRASWTGTLLPLPSKTRWSPTPAWQFGTVAAILSAAATTSSYVIKHSMQRWARFLSFIITTGIITTGTAHHFWHFHEAFFDFLFLPCSIQPVPCTSSHPCSPHSRVHLCQP